MEAGPSRRQTESQSMAFKYFISLTPGFSPVLVTLNGGAVSTACRALLKPLKRLILRQPSWFFAVMSGMKQIAVVVTPSPRRTGRGPGRGVGVAVKSAGNLHQASPKLLNRSVMKSRATSRPSPFIPLPIRWGEGNRCVKFGFHSTRNSEEPPSYYLAKARC